ncbi:MAG: MotA/TolQ/ExbB proton channel family protein [bacterium]|nr:MotA/TolQ/ExbB proton channel family protein [bacterium]
MSLIDVFKAGGPLMWPLAACSLIAVTIIVERGINLRSSRILNPVIVERVVGLVEGGRVDRAIEICRESPGIFSNIVLAGLEIVGKGESSAKEAVEDAGRHESVRVGRYVGALGTVAAVAPLIGLLGTVTGMIEVFQTISESGAGQAAELADGIYQALITTATGLLVAIPTLVAHNFFRGKADLIVTDLERESLRALRGLFRAPAVAASPEGVPAPTAAVARE